MTPAFAGAGEYGVEASGNTGRFGYAGQLRLPGTGLTHNRNRLYNASLGRFMTTDPIGQAGGLNLYGYVGGDPVNFSDPWGLARCVFTYRNGDDEVVARQVVYCPSKWGDSLTGDALKQWLQDDPFGFGGPGNFAQRERDVYRVMLGPLATEEGRCRFVSRNAGPGAAAAEAAGLNGGLALTEGGASFGAVGSLKGAFGVWQEVGGQRQGYYTSGGLGAGFGGSMGVSVGWVDMTADQFLNSHPSTEISVGPLSFTGNRDGNGGAASAAVQIPMPNIEFDFMVNLVFTDPHEC